MELNKMQKNAELCCIICNFKCSKKSNLLIHYKTKKHIYRNNGNEKENAEIKKINEYICNCGKTFLTNSGLWKHKNNGCYVKITNNELKKHEPIEPIIKTNKDDLHINNLIFELIKTNNELQKQNNDFIKENQEFKNLILEIVKKDTYNTTNNTNISNNKSFNLNLFLNETCKDAMNIMDFVESIKLQLSDLERVGEIGYVEGISNIIIKNLKELDVSQRPVHCTDKKRETIYIKDQDKWEKDEEQKKMHKIVRKVAAKNARLVLKYKELHPDCNTYQSKLSDQYNKIIIEAMGGSGDDDFEKEEKIIRNISKQIGIEKE